MRKVTITEVHLWHERGSAMARQFWQNIHNGELWAVEVDDDGHVIGTGGPLYTSGEYLREDDFTNEDNDIFATLDNDWMEAHKADFVLYGDEREIA